MEYTQDPVEKVFAPAFGYGYDPDRKEIEEQKAFADVHGSVHTAKGMPRPKNDPFVLLVFVVLMLIALLIGSVLSANIQTGFYTRQRMVPARVMCQSDEKIQCSPARA